MCERDRRRCGNVELRGYETKVFPGDKERRILCVVPAAGRYEERNPTGSGGACAMEKG